MEYAGAIFTVALVHLLAVMSPGPDFIMTMRNSLVYSRRTGMYSAIGLGLGILVHVTYCMAGIALVISQSIVLFSVIKYLGAAYLIYIGIQSLRAKSNKDGAAAKLPAETQDLTKLQAIRSGFMTNVLNPKATLFFLSLFTLVIQPGTPMAVKMIMGAEMVLATMAWFMLVAVLVSHRSVKKHMSKIQHYVERTMGGILILFGVKLATTQAK
jgi:RhtB (resistance to homoserine/threonine) family protein